MVQFAPTAQAPTSDPLARAQRLAALIEATPPAPSRPSQSIGEAAARGIGAGLNAYRAAKLAGAEGDARMSQATSLADIILPGGDPNDPKRQALINYVAGGGQVNDTIMRSLGLGAPAEPIIHEVFDQATGQKTYAISRDNGQSWEPFGGVEKPDDASYRPVGGPIDRLGLGLPPQDKTPLQLNQTTGKVDKIGGGDTNVNINGEKLTEGQSKDINFYSRGTIANRDLAGVEQALTNLPESLWSGVPIAGNYAVSPEYQRAKRAASEFLAVILRKDTGAAVTPAEFELYGPMYLPAPGDADTTLAAKRKAREDALSALKLGLGTARPLADNIDQELANTPPPIPEAAPVPTATNPDTGEKLMWDGQAWVPAQ